MVPKETIQVLFSMEDKDRKEKEKVIRKLHRQFSHLTSQRLKLLLKDAGIKDQECIELVEDITNRCDICLKYKRTPPRLVGPCERNHAVIDEMVHKIMADAPECD